MKKYSMSKWTIPEPPATLWFFAQMFLAGFGFVAGFLILCLIATIIILG